MAIPFKSDIEVNKIQGSTKYKAWSTYTTGDVLADIAGDTSWYNSIVTVTKLDSELQQDGWIYGPYKITVQIMSSEAEYTVTDGTIALGDSDQWYWNFTFPDNITIQISHNTATLVQMRIPINLTSPTLTLDAETLILSSADTISLNSGEITSSENLQIYGNASLSLYAKSTMTLDAESEIILKNDGNELVKLNVDGLFYKGDEVLTSDDYIVLPPLTSTDWSVSSFLSDMSYTPDYSVIQSDLNTNWLLTTAALKQQTVIQVLIAGQDARTITVTNGTWDSETQTITYSGTALQMIGVKLSNFKLTLQ